MEGRRFKTIRCRCKSIGWSVGSSVSMVLVDEQGGDVRASFWAGNTGQAARAFGLDRQARDFNWDGAVGQEVLARFGANGMVDRLERCES